jgi:hypothetical protein
MASWIIVSSRWVAGLSTGSRPVSASVTMKMAAKASTCPGASASEGVASMRAAMWPRLVEPALQASAKIASAMVGSASAATVISRLAPMPPKGEPGSSPAKARKKVPSSSRYTTTRRSPAPSKGSGTARSGTRRVTATVLAKTMKGAARKSQEALLETTTSLAKSLRSSRYGCHGGEPRRFWRRAFIQRMAPTRPGAKRSPTAACIGPSSQAFVIAP